MDAFDRWVGGEKCAVDRADGGTEDQVGLDRALRERAEHSDLVRAEDSAAAEHECNLAATLLVSHCTVLPARGAQHETGRPEGRPVRAIALALGPRRIHSGR